MISGLLRLRHWKTAGGLAPVILVLLSSLLASPAPAQPGLLSGSRAAFVTVTDYPDIQAAVDALPAGGGTVYFPPGEYSVSTPVRVTGGDVTLAGAGAATHIHNRSTDGGDTFQILGQGSGNDAYLWRVQIRNMHLTGTGDCGHGIYARYVNEILIEDTWIDHHGKSGIFLDECIENPRIADNNIAYNRDAGITLDGCHDIIISANQLEENGDGIHSLNGFNTTATGNNIDDHLRYGIYFDNMCGSIITGNMIEQCVNHSLVLDGDSDGTTISGNIFRECAQRAVLVRSARGVNIAANTFEGTPDWSVLVYPGNSNITVTGNTFSKGPYADVFGIRMEQVRDVTISGNTLVEPHTGGIEITGLANRNIAIVGNTITDPADGANTDAAGILLENTTDSNIAQNIVMDTRARPRMRFAVEEVGSSGRNVILGNRVSRGRAGGIRALGGGTRVELNLEQ